MPFTLKDVRHAADVVAPRGVYGVGEVVEGEGGGLLEDGAVRPYLAVAAHRSGHLNMEIDRRGEDVAVVVIGVLADQVYSAGRADDEVGRKPEEVLKSILQATQLIHRPSTISAATPA